MQKRCTACGGAKVVRSLGMMNKTCVTCFGAGFITYVPPVVAAAIPDIEHIEGAKKPKSKQAEA